MQQKLLKLPIAAALSGLVFIGSAAQARKPSCAEQPYGVDGQWSEQDLNNLFYIAFPQTYQDMKGTFGFPFCRDAKSDYYQVEGTTHVIAIDYRGSTAIGWRAWEVQK